MNRRTNQLRRYHNLEASEERNLRRPGKRLFDLVCAAVGLIALFPLGALIAWLIRISDGSPIFFAQIRVGQFGKLFRIWKFRTMVNNADQLGLAVTKKNDPRVTRIGKVLRKTKLDELPQLWNVLVGEMSFVGPRPEVPKYVALYSPEQREVLNLRPGITDLATIVFREEEALLQGGNVEEFYVELCLPKKIELNRQYAARASLWQDMKIILGTLVSLAGDGIRHAQKPAVQRAFHP